MAAPVTKDQELELDVESLAYGGAWTGSSSSCAAVSRAIAFAHA